MITRKEMILSFSIENGIDHMFKVQEMIEQIVKTDVVESGCGFGFRDLYFDISDQSKEQMLEKTKQVKNILQSENIQNYECWCIDIDLDDDYEEIECRETFHGCGFTSQ